MREKSLQNIALCQGEQSDKLKNEPTPHYSQNDLEENEDGGGERESIK